MKKIAFLFFLTASMLKLSHAATVTGHVISSATSNPSPNVIVTISDSAGTFAILDTTDAAGWFSKALPSGVTSGTLIKVSVNSDSTSAISFHPFNGSNITTNLFIGGWRNTATLHGSVLLNSSLTPNNGVAKIYVILKAYDPIIMDTTLTAIDSMLTNSTGGFSKTYSSVPSGIILVKGMLLSAHPSYASFLPTYALGVLNWNNANPISGSFFSSNFNYLFSMVAGTNPGGAGFIGGSVLLGANKSTAVGDPLSSRPIVLTTAAGKAVAITYSDAAGKFQFPNLAYGTYKLFGDAWGKANPPLTVTISQSAQSVNNIVFEEKSKSFVGRIGNNLSAGAAAALNALKIYPNPVTDMLRISGLSGIKGDKTVVLYDAAGRAVVTKQLPAGNAPELSTAALPSGVYLLKLQTEAGTATLTVTK